MSYPSGARSSREGESKIVSDTSTTRSTSLVDFRWKNSDDLWGGFKHTYFGTGMIHDVLKTGENADVGVGAA